MTAVVHGLAELSSAFAKAGPQATRQLRTGLRQAAEPVRRDAQTLALEQIRRMPFSPQWAVMRVGANRTLVYVAPVRRGVKRTGDRARRRPNMADLMMDRAMEPALARNENQAVHAIEAALDRAVADFNHGGP